MEIQKTTLSKDAYNHLSLISNPIIRLLLEKIEISDSVWPVHGSTFIDSFGKDLSDVIKYNKGKERKDSLKTGRLLKTILDSFSIPVKPTIIEDIFNELKSTFITDNIETIKGEDIKKYYDQNNYLFPGIFETPTFEGSLSKSCMRFNFCSSWLDFYSKNDENVELWILKNDDNKLLARALVWTLSTGEKLLDRVYYSDISQAYYFMQKAKSYGYLLVNTIEWDPELEPQIRNNKDDIIPSVFVLLKHKNFHEFPYLDALPYLDLKLGILSNNSVNITRNNPILRLKSLRGKILTKHVIQYPDSRNSALENFATTVPLMAYKNGSVYCGAEIYDLMVKFPFNAKALINYPRIDKKTDIIKLIFDNNTWDLLEYYPLNENIDRTGVEILWKSPDLIPYLEKNPTSFWVLNDTELLNLIEKDKKILLKNMLRVLDKSKIKKNLFSYNKELHDYLLTRSSSERTNCVSNLEHNLNSKITYANYIFDTLDVDNWLYYMKMRWWRKDTSILFSNLSALEDMKNNEDKVFQEVLEKILSSPIFHKLMEELKKELSSSSVFKYWEKKIIK